MITAEDIHGTWRLADSRSIDKDGKLVGAPYGPVPMGRLVLDPSGRMMATVVNAELPLRPGHERAFASYCGTYVVEDGVLKTRVDGAVPAHILHSVQVRNLDFRNGKLVLQPPLGDEGIQSELHWERTGAA